MNSQSVSASDRAAVADYPHWKVGWYAVAILSGAAILSYTDRYVLNLLVDSVRHDLSITDTQVSYLQGAAFAIVYSLMAVPIGRYADRHNRRNLIVAGIAVWSLATAACGLAASFGELFLARIFVGIGEAVLAPSVLSLIPDFFPPNRRGAPIGVFLTAVNLGGALAALVGGALIGAFAGGRLAGLPWAGHLEPWRAVMIFLAVPGALVAVALATIREPERGGLLHAAAHGGDVRELRAVLGYLSGNKWTFILFFAAFTLDSLRQQGTDSWMPMVFVRQFGLSPAQTGQMMGWTLLACTGSGALLGGLLSDWVAHNGRIDAVLRLVLAASCSQLLVLAFPLLPTAGAALAGYGAYSLLINLGWTAGQAAILNAVPTAMRGFTTGIQCSMYTLIGMGFGPTAVAATMQLVYGKPSAVGDSIFTVALPCSLLITALLWRSLPHYRATRMVLLKR